MTRRSALGGMVAIAVVAISVPAIAQVDNGPVYRAADVKRIGKELRKLAHNAQRKANRALRLARRAQGQGPAGPQGQAGAPGAPGTPGSAPAFAQAAGMETTADDLQYVQLPGGPSVTVNVPQAASGPAGTGFIEVAASAVVSDEAGAVGLFEDGVLIGENTACEQGLGTPGPPLFASLDGLGGTYGTPGTLDPITVMCATTGEPGPVTFLTTPGSHTYELRYNYCGCSGTDADFSERRLWVTPLG